MKSTSRRYGLLIPIHFVERNQSDSKCVNVTFVSSTHPPVNIMDQVHQRHFRIVSVVQKAQKREREVGREWDLRWIDGWRLNCGPYLEKADIT